MNILQFYKIFLYHLPIDFIPYYDIIVVVVVQGYIIHFYVKCWLFLWIACKNVEFYHFFITWQIAYVMCFHGNIREIVTIYKVHLHMDFKQLWCWFFISNIKFSKKMLLLYFLAIFIVWFWSLALRRSPKSGQNWQSRLPWQPGVKITK